MWNDPARLVVASAVAAGSAVAGVIIGMVNQAPRYALYILFITLIIVPVSIYARAVYLTEQERALAAMEESQREARARIRMIEYRRLNGIPEPER